MWKYFSLFIRGPDGFESWKKTGGRKSCDTLPFKEFFLGLFEFFSDFPFFQNHLTVKMAEQNILGPVPAKKTSVPTGSGSGAVTQIVL